MTNSEFLGMLVVASLSLISLIAVFVKLSWNMSKTLTEISATLKAIVKITDEHDKDIKELKESVHKHSNEIDLIQQQCKFAHKFKD